MAQTKLQADLNFVQRAPLEIALLDGDLNIISKLDDEPNDVGGLSSTQLKAEFDKAGNVIKTYLNETLIPEILSTDSAERVREEQEQTRVRQETARLTAEEDRLQQETIRKANESNRVDLEGQRKQAETERLQREEERCNQEALRLTDEEARRLAESSRLEEESLRRQREELRISQETERRTQETQRREAETNRMTAEQQRADETNGIVAQANTAVAVAEEYVHGKENGYPGIQYYASLAEAYVKGGKYPQKPGTPPEVFTGGAGAKDYADMAKAYLEGGNYFIWPEQPDASGRYVPMVYTVTKCIMDYWREIIQAKKEAVAAAERAEKAAQALEAAKP